jgi:hypothetical protein
MLESKFAIDHLPPAFKYPYGTEHMFDIDRYRDVIPKVKVRSLPESTKYASC